MSLNKKWLYIISFAVLIDQVSKVLVQKYLIYKSTNVIIPDFLYLTYITNDGISFGWDPFGNSIILFILSVLACFFIIQVLFHSKNEVNLIQISLCMIIGGALGNLIDRFFTAFKIMNYKGVIDFIDIGYYNYRFYIFNFADSFITIGIILYIISFIIIKSSDAK